MTDLVTYDLADGVARITMDDGKVNVMSVAMLAALDGALDRAEGDDAVVVLRSGRAGVFSAGFDLKVFAANDVAGSVAMLRAGAELALRLMGFPTPVVGAVAGHAFPMGTFLLLACDARIGAAGGWRMGLNEVAISITPPGFAIELARSRLHPAWLSRTVTMGEMYGPEDALTAGFIDRIVPADAMDATAEALAQSLTKLHRPSHRAAKRALRRDAMAKIRAAIDTEFTEAAYAGRPLSDVVLPR